MNPLHCLKVSQRLHCWLQFKFEMTTMRINNAVADWRLRLTACVNAHGGHFEFKLQLNTLSW